MGASRRSLRPVLFGIALSVAGALLVSRAARAEDPAETACHRKESTYDISVCLQNLTAQWDKRLNAAYQAARTSSENDIVRGALLHAQRAWLAYRLANCGWYDSHEGTIREILAADCMLDMTRARALELEASLRP